MSTKRVCDFCGEEMQPIIGTALVQPVTGPNRAQAEISISVKKLSESHDICRYCIIDAVKGLDDRGEE